MRLDTDLAPNFTETERVRRRSCFSNTARLFLLYLNAPFGERFYSLDGIRIQKHIDVSVDN